MAEEKKAVAVEPKPKLKLKISQIKEDLRNGIDRDGMAGKYGVSKAEIMRLFKDERLKGLKVNRAPTIDLIDDEESEPVKATANKTKVEPKVEQEVAQPTPAGPGEAPTVEKGVW